MLKKYTLLRAADVNTETGSSDVSDVNGQDSSSAEQDVKQEATEGEEQSQEGADGNEASEVTTGEKEAGDQENSQQGEEKVEETKEGGEAEHEEAIPYERFKEVNTKVENYEREMATIRPLAEQSRALNDFLTGNNIPPQELQAALTYLQLKRSDPAAAYRQLKGDYDALAMLSGDVLPPDLQAEVAASTMSAERAQEIARLRGQNRYQQWQQQNGQQGQQQQQAQMIAAASSQWTQNKQTLDPDLKPGSDLWQLVQDKINAMPPFRSPQEAYQGAEKAYTDAKAFLLKFQPRSVTPARRVSPHRNSSANSEVVVKTPEDVVRVLSANGGKRPSRLKYA